MLYSKSFHSHWLNPKGSPMKFTPEKTLPTRLIRVVEVSKMTGIPKSSIYALIRDNAFPCPVRLSVRAVAFVESEIINWIAARIDERNVQIGGVA